ncbi:MAG: hypothetical protein HZA78_12475 [Candidatus Schekmanbacteria bacterium]|nr:hypothetical protein [Candidatus Schekmanbacteria bacterium]
MLKKFLLSIVLGGLLAFNATVSLANDVWLTPAEQNVKVLDPVKLDLWMDFHDDPTLGSGVDTFYNSGLLSFVSFEFDTTLPGWGKPSGAYYQPTVLPDGELNGLGFGDFGGLTGPYKIGTFTFQAINKGKNNVTLQQNDIPLGEFYSANTFDAQVINFKGAEVNVIPEPVSAILFLFGMDGLGICKKKKEE